MTIVRTTRKYSIDVLHAQANAVTLHAPRQREREKERKRHMCLLNTVLHRKEITRLESQQRNKKWRDTYFLYLSLILSLSLFLFLIISLSHPCSVSRSLSLIISLSNPCSVSLSLSLRLFLTQPLLELKPARCPKLLELHLPLVNFFFAVAVPSNVPHVRRTFIDRAKRDLKWGSFLHLFFSSFFLLSHSLSCFFPKLVR